MQLMVWVNVIEAVLFDSWTNEQKYKLKHIKQVYLLNRHFRYKHTRLIRLILQTYENTLFLS